MKYSKLFVVYVCKLEYINIISYTGAFVQVLKTADKKFNFLRSEIVVQTIFGFH